MMPLNISMALYPLSNSLPRRMRMSWDSRKSFKTTMGRPSGCGKTWKIGESSCFDCAVSQSKNVTSADAMYFPIAVKSPSTEVTASARWGMPGMGFGSAHCRNMKAKTVREARRSPRDLNSPEWDRKRSCISSVTSKVDMLMLRFESTLLDAFDVETGGWSLMAHGKKTADLLSWYAYVLF